MPYGYKGQLLHIDLSKKNHHTIPIPEKILWKYIGGRGLGAKLYWDLIPPDADPLEKDNIFMVLTGPLSGTMGLGTGKHLIVTKSPATGGWLDSYSSGRMSPELKFAGHDGLIITGKAENPILLTIKDDIVEFLDANHLWGKGAIDTEQHIRKSFHPECGCICIGPAGENLLPFACVSSDYFRKAGRGGAGAVMGSKNLKLIAVKGSGGVSCADMDGLHKLILKHQKKVTFKMMTPMTVSITNAAGMLPTRNFSKGQFKKAKGAIDRDAVMDVKVADKACFGCFASCSSITKVKDGIFKDLMLEGPEYETLAMLGANLEVDYLPAVMKANYLCDDLGMDTISAGVIIGFAMECYERGILNKEDTEGIELEFGNYLAVIELLELMAHKKGFGQFCSLGVKEMARMLGRGTEDYAMHSKGLEFPAYDPRAGWGATITYSVSPRGACHRRAWPPAAEIIGGMNPFTIEGKAEAIIKLMNQRCILHSLIVCDMPSQLIRLNYRNWATYLKLITGNNYTGDDLINSAEVIETLIRMINIREGFTTEDDMLPQRTLEESLPEGPAAGKIVGKDNFFKMRSEYYLCRGWDKEGIPTKETIAKYEIETDPNILI